MNRQTQLQLKRHPLIRFIRSVYRLLRVLFKPTRSNARLNSIEWSSSSDRPQIELTDRYLNVGELSDLSSIVDKPKPELTDKYITVGQLFELVQWQLPAQTELKAPKPPINTTKSLARSGILNTSRTDSIDRNLTVYELFELVQWQLPAPTDSSAMSATNIETISHDFSLN
ncbi:MAG: hypothetical protein RLZZ135_1763 [Cyanobacteriota bacterium]|jgi:hypothetical protein